MITFTDFVRMKQQDMSGKDVKKTEIAAVRAIIECIKENEKFVISIDKKKLIETFVSKLLNKKKTMKENDEI